MRNTPVLLVLAGLALPVWAAQAAAAPANSPDRVVVVMRHGVRSPTKPPEALATLAADPWPQWPVAPGELTPHGARAVALMGVELARRFGAACADTYVWADSADHRTLQSGDAVLEGLGCKRAAEHAQAGSTDPLFHGDGAQCKADALAAVKARGDVNALGPAYDRARATLQKIVAPNCVGDTCPLSGTNTLKGGKKGVSLDGPLDSASTVSENLLLEYTEGFTGAQLGWGRLDAANLATSLSLHNLYAKLMRQTPALAVANSGLLAHAVVDAVAGKATASPPAAVPQNAKLVVLVGHDTNLSNLAGILGVDWTLPGQPDLTAPDTALVFTRRGDQVEVGVMYQSLDDLRNLTPLTAAHPAGYVPVAVPACHGACTPRQLADIVAAAEKICAP